MLPERNQASSEFDPIGMKPCFLPSRPEEQIIDEYLKVWNTVYEPRRFLERTYRFCLGMRPTRGATARRQGKALPQTAPKARVPLRQQIRDAYMVLALSWQLGLVASTRGQFWRQLLGILRKNPSPGYSLSDNLYTGRRCVPPPGPNQPTPDQDPGTIESVSA